MEQIRLSALELVSIAAPTPSHHWQMLEIRVEANVPHIFLLFQPFSKCTGTQIVQC